MTIINLTPHDIHILLPSSETRTIPRSGVEARASSTIAPYHDLDGIPTCFETFGTPVDLPEPSVGVYLIVSTITAQAARVAGRVMLDLLVPGAPVRDTQGRIVGCRTLVRQR